MKVAIAHDYLNQRGGAERVVAVLREIFPEAPIYTSIYLGDHTFEDFRTADIRTSFMQHLPLLESHFKKYFLLYPKAFEHFSFDGYDLILTSSSAYAKFVITPPGACHICYCYTPMRFAWRYDAYVDREDFGWLIRSVLPFFLGWLRHYDLATVSRVHHFIAISEFIRRRIKETYGRDSEVIYPPVETAQFSIGKGVGEHFLLVSRLVSYKRLDIVIEAFNRLKRPLIIVGEGPYESALKELAGATITFCQRVSSADLAELYSTCRAFLFPGEEDFGIAPVEAMASGRPVIAYAAGGALETVVPLKGSEFRVQGPGIEGKALTSELGHFGIKRSPLHSPPESPTGVFFGEQTPDAVVRAIRLFEENAHRFRPADIRRWAERFDKEVFKDKMLKFVTAKYEEFLEAPRGRPGSHPPC